ncbi:S-layer homology domain-containing protein [Heyndrickxia oleronia]|uniref:S-layer homology domain-containing protein n=1 Tax=Heyndrickxia oleronia TaxID=38875 RepID=UPI001C0EFA6B|nr:S-layer homology domain-containing protein [Heyndrickxia oleronia]MBU5212979.1 S-layer homology domain-containing protein [Heyndrickxia oleronia]
MRKRICSSLFALLLLVGMLCSPSYASSKQKLDYLALGDSLAAGQTPNKGIDKGYADFLAQQLDEVQLLGSFDKRFAVPGYTTTNVLEDIQNNISKPDLSGKEANIQKMIADAEIITIDAGANDLLKEIKVDFSKGTLQYDPEKLKAAITTVGTNTVQIINQIRELNSNAKIYVMGYYNPFPNLSKEQTTQLLQLLQLLNTTIQEATEKFGAIYVATAEEFNVHAKDYLPNPVDIHPNKDGYLVIANSFWKSFKNNGQTIAFKDTVPSWAADEVIYLAQKGIIAGYDNGKFGANDLIQRVHSGLLIKRSIIFDDTIAPDPNYKDVNKNTYGYTTIAKLTEKGIFSGNNGYFYPSHSLTRGEMAKILVEAFHLKGSLQHTFNDVNKHWANEYIMILQANQITQGYPDGSFKPNEKITRAEFSTMLARMMNTDFRTK